MWIDFGCDFWWKVGGLVEVCALGDKFFWVWYILNSWDLTKMVTFGDKCLWVRWVCTLGAFCFWVWSILELYDLTFIVTFSDKCLWVKGLGAYPFEIITPPAASPPPCPVSSLLLRLLLRLLPSPHPHAPSAAYRRESTSSLRETPG